MWFIHSTVCEAIHNRLHTGWYHLYEHSRKDKYIQKTQTSGCLMLGGRGRDDCQESWGKFLEDRNVLKLDCGHHCTIP